MNRNKIIVHQGKEPSAEPINITAGETWTVGDIKSIIQAKTSLPVYSRLLIMNNHQKLLFENHAKVDTFHSWPEPYVLTFFQKFNTHESVDVDQKLPGLEHWIRRPDTLDWYLEVHVLNKDQNNWPIINIRIRSIANVLQLKMKIDEHGGIPTVRQDLVALLMPINQGPLCASLLDWYKLEDVIPNATGQYRIFLTERGRSNTKPAKMVVKKPDNLFVAEATFDMDFDCDLFTPCVEKYCGMDHWLSQGRILFCIQCMKSLMSGIALFHTLGLSPIRKYTWPLMSRRTSLIILAWATNWLLVWSFTVYLFMWVHGLW